MLIKETVFRQLCPSAGREGDSIPELRSWLHQLASKIKSYRLLSYNLIKTTWPSLKQRSLALSRGFFNHFPAIHLKDKMDTWDYAANFSSELLATGLVLLVVVCTVAVFGISHKEHDFSDDSLAGRLLAYHSSFNGPLYATQNSLKTTIVKQGDFIPAALASDEPLSADSTTDNTDNTADSNIDDSGMTKPNPDTVRGLLDKQILIYETKDGDTLGSIAKQFNISGDTIKWANHLQDNTIKTGWYLKILPVNGVLYQATSNDTWPDICKYFSAGNCDAIIAYNGHANAEDIQAGDWIIIQDGTIPAPKPKPGAKKPTDSLPHGHIPAGFSHSFPWGYCTWYVASKVKISFGGNAKAWLGNAKAAGYVTGSKPAPGAVAVTTESRKFGHVVLVEKVSSEGITVSEMNFDAFGKVDTRFIPFSDGVIRGYIYTK